MWGVILGAIAIGVLLGLLGSGGSILTVPILVYGLGHPERAAMAEALAIVAAVAFAGAVPYAAKRQVDWRNVLWFGIPGVVGMYVGAWLSQFFSAAMLLVFLALMMLVAAGLMVRETLKPSSGPEEASDDDSRPLHPLWRVTTEGLIVGTITGLVSVGGGFLIVPALVLLGGLPMRLAVGTSLVIIGLKSLSGFFKQQQIAGTEGLAVDWSTVGLFVAFGIAGTLIGRQLSQRINQRWLKRGFALFLVLMGAWIVWREAPEVWPAQTTPAASASESVGQFAENGLPADRSPLN